MQLVTSNNNLLHLHNINLLRQYIISTCYINLLHQFILIMMATLQYQYDSWLAALCVL